MRPQLLALLLLSGCYSSASIGIGDDDTVDLGANDDDTADDDDTLPDDDDTSTDDDDTSTDDDDTSTDDDDTLPDDDDTSTDDDDTSTDDDDTSTDDDDTLPDDDDTSTDDDDALPDDDDTLLDDDDSTPPLIDGDGDGYYENTDCDDADPLIHPGSLQLLDGVDSNCDGQVDWLVDIWISGDDAFEYCIDDENTILGSGQNWPTGFHFQEWLTSGNHAVGIQGWDLGQVITAAIAHIEISNGTQWVSDGTWRFDPNPTAGPDDRSGWCGPWFDDSGWQLANVIGPIGTSPWGNAPSTFPAGSTANWIWDYYPVNLNTQYLRKNIVLP